MHKQHVLLLGATGVTGSSILQGCGSSCAPSSVAKPQIKKLADHGIKIRVGDIEEPTEALVDLLAGVDGHPGANPLATAAKEAGVKRFVPKFWQNAESPQKEEVYQHIRKLYLPYTIIDVGYWHQLSFPTLPSGRVNYASLFKSKTEIHNGGSMPTMLTDLRDIGRFVALIVRDARTLNKFIFAYGDLLPENEIFETIEAMSGEKIERKYVSSTYISIKSLLTLGLLGIRRRDHRRTAQLAVTFKANPSDFRVSRMDYFYSKYVRGDNTPAYGTYLGYLNARELYPDIKPTTFREFVRELLDGKIEKLYGDLVLDHRNVTSVLRSRGIFVSL
ncbi:hypothetical protein K438DRAFT_1780878 [Mycena galopus ATCC 62051]|nr:hypothetical protein K438DRAFT_1780878 [Mycena galopus ATCC 62051]